MRRLCEEIGGLHYVLEHGCGRGEQLEELVRDVARHDHLGDSLLWLCFFFLHLLELGHRSLDRLPALRHLHILLIVLHLRFEQYAALVRVFLLLYPQPLIFLFLGLPLFLCHGLLDWLGGLRRWHDQGLHLDHDLLRRLRLHQLLQLLWILVALLGFEGLDLLSFGLDFLVLQQEAKETRKAQQGYSQASKRLIYQNKISGDAETKRVRSCCTTYEPGCLRLSPGEVPNDCAASVLAWLSSIACSVALAFLASAAWDISSFVAGGGPSPDYSLFPLLTSFSLSKDVLPVAFILIFEILCEDSVSFTNLI